MKFSSGKEAGTGYRKVWRRVALALGLFLLAPLTAEYLIGYDTSTGDFRALLAGLIFLAPLYGGPALIIREVARRTGHGWPTMILLALAFGVAQAGLIDHSLFNTSYRDIPYWQEILGPTAIPALGISTYTALNFVASHAIWSYGVPIALVETFASRRRTTPWLGKPGTTIVVAAYLIAAALIFRDHVVSERFLPAAPQLLGAAAMVLALVGLAFAVGSRPRPPVDRPAPSAWLVGAVSLATFSLTTLIEVILTLLGSAATFVVEWRGVALTGALLASLATLVARWSRRQGWGANHRLAVAGGALLSNVVQAFLVQPLGDVAIHEKLIHNTVFALGAVALLAAASRAARRTGAA